MRAQPGARLHRWLRRVAPDEVVRGVLEPAIADLQYEAEHAATPHDRRRAVLRGYVGIARALIFSIEPADALPSTRAISALALGSGIATAGFFVEHWPRVQHLTTGLAMTPFYVVLFGAIFGCTLLPLLLVVRVFSARPALLAIAGLLCSPAPLIASAYVDHGTLTVCLEALRRTPVSFAVSSLPFISGAIAVGWRYGR